jgi:hypothetical protein
VTNWLFLSVVVLRDINQSWRLVIIVPYGRRNVAIYNVHIICYVCAISVCVKFAYVDAMLYLCMQYFMLYRFYVYGICSFSDADMCVRTFICV